MFHIGVAILYLTGAAAIFKIGYSRGCARSVMDRPQIEGLWLAMGMVGGWTAFCYLVVFLCRWAGVYPA